MPNNFLTGASCIFCYIFNAGRDLRVFWGGEPLDFRQVQQHTRHYDCEIAMRVFVTGAAGFVGSRLSKSLLDRGDEVVGFDNFNDYYSPALKERHLLDLTPNPRFELVRGDLREAESLRETFQKYRPDAVAHLAAMAAVRYSVQFPLVYADVNVQGTVNLMDAARQIGRPTMVLASTGSVYGSSTPVPFVETASADRPLAPYPASKRAMEIMAHCYHYQWQLPTTILRFFNVYGPHGRPDMMPWQWSTQIARGETLTLYNAGRLKRDWTYIDDVVRGFVAALDVKLAFEIINIGCSCPVENLRFVQILESLIGKKAITKDVPAPTSEPLITYADVTKARKLLSYEPRVSVEQGLENFVEWMREEGHLPR
jgi:UDP-glucuronate 4-epimerase